MKKLAALLVLVCLLLASTAAAADHGATWTVPGDFATLQEAIDSPDVMPGDTIRVGPGVFYGALVDKGVHIVGVGMPLIDDGPDYAGFSQGFRLGEGSDGASFSHLAFAVDLAIYSRDVDGVTVDHCRFDAPFQAVTNWGGSYWNIHHNTIRDLTNGGAGVVIAAMEGRGTLAQYNVVAHNLIRGTVYLAEEEDGFNSPGIGLGAFSAGVNISGNVIEHNQVRLLSADPDEDQAAGVAFWDLSGGDEALACDLIYDNEIAFNDLRRSDNRYEFVPAALEGCNHFSKNK